MTPYGTKTPTTLVLPAKLLVDYSIFHEELHLQEEILEWCEGNVGPWKLIKQVQKTDPKTFVFKEDNGIKSSTLSFSFDMAVFEPAIQFETDTDAIFFKLRWF